MPECYTEYNVLGLENGNCGVLAQECVPCAPENAQCGQIMCEQGNFQASPVFNVFVQSVMVGLTEETCKTFSLNTSIDFMHPGLVEDGTKCGSEFVSWYFNEISK